MNFSKELFIILAKAMTKDQVIQKLEDAIAEYKEAKLLNQNIKEAEENLQLSTHLFIMNSLNKEPLDIINEMNKVTERVKFFETDKN